MAIPSRPKITQYAYQWWLDLVHWVLLCATEQYVSCEWTHETSTWQDYQELFTSFFSVCQEKHSTLVSLCLTPSKLNHCNFPKRLWNKDVDVNYQKWSSRSHWIPSQTYFVFSYAKTQKPLVLVSVCWEPDARPWFFLMWSETGFFVLEVQETRRWQQLWWWGSWTKATAGFDPIFTVRLPELTSSVRTHSRNGLTWNLLTGFAGVKIHSSWVSVKSWAGEVFSLPGMTLKQITPLLSIPFPSMYPSWKQLCSPSFFLSLSCVWERQTIQPEFFFGQT